MVWSLTIYGFGRGGRHPCGCERYQRGSRDNRGGGHGELEVGHSDRVPVVVGDTVCVHDAGLARVVADGIVLAAVLANYHISRIKEENLARHNTNNDQYWFTECMCITVSVTPIMMPAIRMKIQQMKKAKQRVDLQQHHRFLHTYIKELSKNGTTINVDLQLKYGIEKKRSTAYLFSTCHSPRSYHQNKLPRVQRQNYWISN